ncbi:MAG: hypothetical protein AAF682_29100 [Planctomycetota bacterium]
MKLLDRSLPIAILLTVAPLASALDEQGEDDFVISASAGLTDHTLAEVASAPEIGTYLVVWHASTTGFGGATQALKARLYDAETRSPITAEFTVATLTEHESHDVAYSSAQQEYMVVWTQGSKIHSERIGASIGDLRFSSILHVPSFAGDPEELSIAYAEGQDKFLLAWHQPLALPLANGDEIHGGLIDGATSVHGAIQTFSSDEELDVDSRSIRADIAYNSTEELFVIVWQTNRIQGGSAQGAWKIWGRRVDAATGELIGDDIYLLKDLVSGESSMRKPRIAYNPANDEYLVTYIVSLSHVFGTWLEGNDLGYVTTQDSLNEVASSVAVVADTRHGGFLVGWTGANAQDVREVYVARAGDSEDGFLGLGEQISEAEGADPSVPGAKEIALTFDHETVDFLAVWNAEQTGADVKSNVFGQFWTAYPTELEATETVRAGSNPEGFSPGQTTGPVLAKTWDPAVDLALDDLAGVMLLGFAATDLTVAGITGALLCEPSNLTPILADDQGGFAVPIPELAALIGSGMCTQAFRITATEIVAQNAIDLVLGTF